MIDEERGEFLRNFAVEAIDDGLKTNSPELFHRFRSVINEDRETTYSIGQSRSPVRLKIHIRQWGDDVIHMNFDYLDEYNEPLGLNYDEFFPYGVVEDESLFDGYVGRYVKTYMYLNTLIPNVEAYNRALYRELGVPDSQYGDSDENLSNTYRLLFIHTIMKIADRFDVGFEILNFTHTKENLELNKTNDRLCELSFGVPRPDFPEYTTLRSYNEDIDIDFVMVQHDIYLKASYMVCNHETGDGVAFKTKKAFGPRGNSERSFATKVGEWFEGFMDGYSDKIKDLSSDEKDGAL